MESLLIWAPESDTDSKAIRRLAEKIVDHYGSEIKVLEGTKDAFNQAAKKPDGLNRAIKIYLKNNRFVIFLIDADGLQSQVQRQSEPNSLVNQIKKAVQHFQGKVFLVLIKQELEAWLLIDCLGICCFFTKEPKNRENQIWINLSRKHQKGKTDLITEAELGGKNAKEYLIELSKKILKTANPSLKPRDIKKRQYNEQTSDKIAEYIQINCETLSRNDSLVEFAGFLQQDFWKQMSKNGS